MAQAGTAPFPTITDDERRRMLEPPTGRVRMVLDTDAHNEIDDQYTIAWALLSQDVLEVEGLYAAPYSHAQRGEALRNAWRQRQSGSGEPPELSAWLDRLEAAGTDPHDLDFNDAATGMEKSYQEILTVFDKLGMDPGERVFRGSTHPLPSATEPVASPAARHLVARALSDDPRPLYVAAIGALTNVASALLLEPAIAERIVVLWTAGYPSTVRQPNASFNMDQDMLASQLLFDCGVPLVYLPGHMVGSQLTMSLPEMETWVAGQGAMGDYLHHLYLNNPIQQQRGVTGHYARSWVIWDLINIAWLLDPSWVPSALVPTPTLGDDTVWGAGPADRHLMREAYNLDRDAIFRDLFMKLESAA
jgi:hypothetical protein